MGAEIWSWGQREGAAWVELLDLGGRDWSSTFRTCGACWGQALRWVLAIRADASSPATIFGDADGQKEKKVGGNAVAERVDEEAQGINIKGEFDGAGCGCDLVGSI
ncbi:MAG: hypothetical protein VX528_03385 [Candidatus Latescibacterota bacterium]|nr:hypothetical protein [Candidatus Latescibacterota bacterium]